MSIWLSCEVNGESKRTNEEIKVVSGAKSRKE